LEHRCGAIKAGADKFTEQILTKQKNGRGEPGHDAFWKG
jgi:hypothetical protein